MDIKLALKANDKCFIVMVCRDLHMTYLLSVGSTQTLTGHETLSIVCYAGFQMIKLSFKIILFGPSPSSLKQIRMFVAFRTNERCHIWTNGRGPSLLCVCSGPDVMLCLLGRLL